ncbi:HNH endonuclease [Xanthomonas hortorum]|uniref:Uncharacterized protein n=1 Tax=Xanthomonas hortorum pv. gardneri TaxID=2754056 RepID=A0A6V7BAY1_9XANT|nr:hypothetical protein [Xanthomonas hortorum]APP78594.1 hypothetical protein BJD10_01695 [Xanthomonas hortorum pv. gardneri]KLA95705.1 hypothetical protein SM19410_14810 [Xanthomonas hortorum pv. gardneri]KLB03381.1 hypothetical protein SM17710_00740 [Xanthomonas hortorum pv. gardneri]KLB04449.1 hypothetical protein SM18210_07195 [Xanthomonas hortorum pv. gardneri]KLB09706.1 hypothetical protein SM22010_12980 [Xanthomonas hortorum pv. gardneri]
MSTQKFSAAEREAIWLAHGKKCAYTRELLDVSSFHIDHVVPESLAANPAELAKVKLELALSDNFDIFGYGNLLPCRSGANLQKGSLVMDKAHTHFFLGIASSKIKEIEAHLLRLEKRKLRGKAIVLLQQCLERGELSPEEVSRILQQHSDQPEHIFELIEGMQFADLAEVRFIAKAEIEALRDRPIRLGESGHTDGVTLTNAADETRQVRTCREYEEAIKEGYFAYSNFDIKISTWFEHQCGLLKSLQAAKTPTQSFVFHPRVSIVDLDLLPFSLFPCIGEPEVDAEPDATYQSKVDDGTLVVKRIRQNTLRIEQPEGMGQQLIEVIRADFTGDGVEDILLFEYCYATHGTLAFGGIRILTRTSAGGKLRSVVPNDT